VLPADSSNTVRAECQIDEVGAENTMGLRVGSNHIALRGLSGTGSSGVQTVNAYRI